MCCSKYPFTEYDVSNLFYFHTLIRWTTFHTSNIQCVSQIEIWAAASIEEGDFWSEQLSQSLFWIDIILRNIYIIIMLLQN